MTGTALEVRGVQEKCNAEIYTENKMNQGSPP